jgi:hypothetical protein
MNKTGMVVGVLLAVLAVPALAQTKASSGRMYKCVDDKGKVFYSDSPSTDCGKNTELNKQGVVIQKVRPTAARVEDPKKNVPASGVRRDRALMATYTTEAEIDAARDRSLQMPNQAVKALEAKLEKTNQELFELKKQADSLAAQQKPLPPELLDEVHGVQRQVAILEADMTQKKASAETIRERYESDKQRFRELKGATAATTATAKN